MEERGARTPAEAKCAGPLLEADVEKWLGSYARALERKDLDALRQLGLATTLDAARRLRERLDGRDGDRVPSGT